MMIKTIAIDEEGYFILPDGVRLNDDLLGHRMLEHLFMNKHGVTLLNHEGEEIIVEPFDKPYVAAQVHQAGSSWEIQLPYQLRASFSLDTLHLDGWDRFHGLTDKNIPFVFSRKAQAEFFNLADSFDDDSLTLNGKKIHTVDYYLEPKDEDVSQAQFWTSRYQENPTPGWDLDSPHPELESIMSQIKLTKRRILVPGCGYGHDAAFLAQQGHIVTAFDLSEEAIAKAQERYGDVGQIEFVCTDIFAQNENYKEQFDLIFEHTCYCAISPQKRFDLIKKWNYWLDDRGQVLGIFFVMPKRSGPPFGGSEWELRQLTQKWLRPLYWTRLKKSPGWRQGAELVIFADKK